MHGRPSRTSNSVAGPQVCDGPSEESRVLHFLRLKRAVPSPEPGPDTNDEPAVPLRLSQHGRSYLPVTSNVVPELLRQQRRRAEGLPAIITPVSGASSAELSRVLDVQPDLATVAQMRSVLHYADVAAGLCLGLRSEAGCRIAHCTVGSFAFPWRKIFLLWVGGWVSQGWPGPQMTPPTPEAPIGTPLQPLWRTPPPGGAGSVSSGMTPL